jgi:hypothetical protein
MRSVHGRCCGRGGGTGGVAVAEGELEVVAAADGFSMSRGHPQMLSRLFHGGGVTCVD